MLAVPGRHRLSRAFALAVTACASVLAGCEDGSCSFLGSPPYMVPRIAQGASLQFPFSVYAKSSGVSSGELLPAIVDFRPSDIAASALSISPNPVEIDPTRGGLVTFTALRNAAPGVYSVQAVCRPRGIHAGQTSAEFIVEVEAATFFSLTATPASLTLTRGTIGSASINIQRDAGFSDPVSFSVDGVPAGAAVGMNTGPTTGTSVGLNFSAGTAPAGTYTIVVTGVAAGRSRSATILVQVLPDEVEVDYSIAVTPASVAVIPGGSAVVAITIDRRNFPFPVSFFIDELATGFIATFTPQTTAGNGTNLTIEVPPGAPFGTMLIVIRALVSDSPTPINDRFGTLLLNIVPPP